MLAAGFLTAGATGLAAGLAAGLGEGASEGKPEGVGKEALPDDGEAAGAAAELAGDPVEGALEELADGKIGELAELAEEELLIGAGLGAELGAGTAAATGEGGSRRTQVAVPTTPSACKPAAC